MQTDILPSATELDLQERVDALFSVLQGAQEEAYIGEPITQLAHALQCAALAQNQGAPDEMVLGALFHDLGHLIAPNAPRMDELGVIDHENIAADALKAYGFSSKVTQVIQGHVQAKRYLCWKKSEYYQRLSAASKGTLAWQGGPMTESEAQTFQSSAEMKAILQVRAWDEQAKVQGLQVPPLETYRGMAIKHLQHQQETPSIDFVLSSEDIERFQRQHYLHIPNPFAGSDLQTLRAWTEDLMRRPETRGKWMKYFEETEDKKRVLCRVENFLPYHQGLKDLIVGRGLMSILAQLMDEEACLFKEKINVKLPGASGFNAHQDAPAFSGFGQKYHITAMISIDDTSPSNGCLQFSEPVKEHQILAQGLGGAIHADVEANLPWRPFETKAGDILFFDSYIPHRSARNTSANARRALYLTYNKCSHGDRRSDYYADKRLKFPPECERIPGVDYDSQNTIYNVGNPIK